MYLSKMRAKTSLEVHFERIKFGEWGCSRYFELFSRRAWAVESGDVSFEREMFRLQFHSILVTNILSQSIAVGQTLSKVRGIASSRNNGILDFSWAMHAVLEWFFYQTQISVRHIFWYKIVLWKTLGGQVSVDRTVLENMVFRCFYGFLTSCKLIFVKKNGIYIKTNIRFRISMKNWVDWDMFQSFKTIFIFFENLPLLPLRVPPDNYQNMRFLKNTICTMEQSPWALKTILRVKWW